MLNHKVVCDETNNTKKDSDNHIVNVDIYTSWEQMTYEEFVSRMYIPPETYEKIKNIHKTQDKIDQAVNKLQEWAYDKYKQSREESLKNWLELTKDLKNT